jgi:hypothetical protein
MPILRLLFKVLSNPHGKVEHKARFILVCFVFRAVYQTLHIKSMINEVGRVRSFTFGELDHVTAEAGIVLPSALSRQA